MEYTTLLHKTWNRQHYYIKHGIDKIIT